MRDDVQTAVTISGERKAGLNVLGGEIRKVVQYFGDGHAASEIVKNVGNGDTRAPNARFPAANARVNRNPFSIIHTV